MKLEAGSGVRGISINYPEQLSSMLPAMAQYPYTIQGRGKISILSTSAYVQLGTDWICSVTSAITTMWTIWQDMLSRM